MPVKLTYNQIIQQSRNFADAHYRIKGSFGNGPLSDQVLHNQLPAFKYYLMWAEDLPMPVEKNVETFAFRFSFSSTVATLEERESDLMSSNVNEVKSDAIKCCKDFLSYWLMDTTYKTMYVEENANIQTFEDLTEDRVAGAYIDIRFRQAFDPNSCAIPMSSVTPPESSCDPVFIYENDILVDTVPSGGEYRYNSSVTEIDISVNGTLFYVDVSTDQDVPVINGALNPVGSKVGSDWKIGASHAIIKNTDGDVILDAAVYAEESSDFVVGNAEVEIINSNATYDVVVSVIPEGAVTHNLPDMQIQLQVDGVNYGSPVTFIPLDNTQTINLSW